MSNMILHYRPKEESEVIRYKKNQKVTTDWCNIIINFSGEKPPKQWNQGIITNIWTCKGDKEQMINQRWITVSSSYGTIVEELLNEEVNKKIKFTQTQGGGKMGGSTTDHIFILRNIVALAKKEARHLFV